MTSSYRDFLRVQINSLLDRYNFSEEELAIIKNIIINYKHKDYHYIIDDMLESRCNDIMLRRKIKRGVN